MNQARVIEIPVSSNGRTGYCRGCDRHDVSLAEVSFPNGKVVPSIHCPACVMKDWLVRGRIMASIGFALWPGYDVSAKYEFVLYE